MRMHGILVAALMGILGGYAGALIAQPTGGFVIDDNVLITATAAAALDVSGGAQFGSGDVALVGTDGKINGPLSTTILDDLSGVNLTSLNASNLGSGTAPTARLGSGTASSSTYLRGNQTWGALDAAHLTTGTMPMARIPNNVIVDVGLDTNRTETNSSSTTWIDTGLSVTLNVDDATNDATIIAWQYIGASSGGADCDLRIVKGTTPTVLVTVPVNGAHASHPNPHSVPMAYEDLNPGSGNVTFKTQVRRSGTTGTCTTEGFGTSSVLWVYEVQD